MEDLMLHVDCFGDALRITQDNLDSKNFYAYNPAFDKGCGKMKNC
jgi:spore coat protein JC